MVAGNQVIYENALTDFRVTVRYTYTRGGLEQDLLLLERPPLPERFGLSSGVTTLLVVLMALGGRAMSLGRHPSATKRALSRAADRCRCSSSWAGSTAAMLRRRCRRGA